MIVRNEVATDAAAIDAVTRAAFRDHPHSNQTEHLIVEKLRAAGMLSVSLVADEDGAVIGHIAFSPVEISEGIDGWFGLGPVSVDPAHQRKGVGTRLVLAGLERLRQRGAAGSVVMGDADFYGKFGFRPIGDLVLADCAPQYFTALALSGPMASGIVRYHSTFYE